VVASSFDGLGASARLEIAANDRSLMVEFSALDYAAPEDNHYSYRLKGFESNWIATPPTRRLATYTNLPPGNYTLQLRGSDHEPPWTPSTLDLTIRVLPAWYQTIWFRLAAGLLAVLLIAALMQLRTAVLRRRQRELQCLVAQRTAELEQRSVELRESQRQLEQMAYFDPLTGLANRRLFDKDLGHLTALSLRGTGSFTLLLIDLDRFKEINDRLGHDAGDALLIEVARRLTGVLRQSDRIFRLGGDEFAVLLAETSDPIGVETACLRIVQHLVQPFTYMNQTLQAGASIGAARCPGHASDRDALYKCADLAMYDAKRAGRNTWRWHVPPPCARQSSVTADC
jgi:diguanylate cyclase (GGDEF)-like protein